MMTRKKNVFNYSINKVERMPKHNKMEYAGVGVKLQFYSSQRQEVNFKLLSFRPQEILFSPYQVGSWEKVKAQKKCFDLSEIKTEFLS
jgi:hypothetical protein